MNAFASRPALRWAVPATAAAVVAAGSFGLSRTAEADPGLPPKSAADLLVDVSRAVERHPDLSGTVRTGASLGLPELPGSAAGGPGSAGQSGPGSEAATGPAALASVLSGTNTWRVWLDGPSRQRLAHIDGSDETAVVRDGATVWLWSSEEQSAVRYALPAEAADEPDLSQVPGQRPLTPQEAARQALAALDPSTRVTTSGTATVAGRPAYELVLDPRSPATRVNEVRIAIDASTAVPLRVEVISTKQADPALRVEFVSVDFSNPDAATFRFTPPAGATVTRRSVELPTPSSAKTREQMSKQAHDVDRPRVIGSGWDAVAVARMPQPADGEDGAPGESLLDALPRVTGAWGSGRLLDGTLFSAVLTDDGRLAVGAVAPETLYAALAER